MPDFNAPKTEPTDSEASLLKAAQPTSGGNGYAERLMKVEFQVDELVSAIREARKEINDNAKAIDVLKNDIKALDTKIDTKIDSVNAKIDYKIEMVKIELFSKIESSKDITKIGIGMLVTLIAGVAVLIIKTFLP
jgi:DNA repair ATPase RecN